MRQSAPFCFATARGPLLVVFVLAATLAGACAKTPQILPVTPSVAVTTDAARGAGRSIAIEVVDVRGTDVVGYRDPADPGSAITTPPETLGNIQRALEDGFRRLGFEVVPVGATADVALEVRLSELGYKRDAAGLVRDLRTVATVEATSVLAGKTVNAIYRDGQGKDTVIAPSLHENAAILNKHLDGALSKLVADPRLTTE
ncbi:MAG: YajG family lipoprotein [Gammaproteobacteria bacterium]